MTNTISFLLLLGVLLPCVLSDQPAVTLSSPSQGSKWKVGSTISTDSLWPNSDVITYSEIKFSLISGDPFDSPTTLQSICGTGGKPACPPITGGTIKINWKLAPSVVYYGEATIWVRARWQAKGSPVIDTLSQSLTILIICDDGSTPKGNTCPTPTPKPSATKKPTPSAKKCPFGTPRPDGSCPTPTKRPTPSKGPTPTTGTTPSKGPTPFVCPNGKPPGPGGVCESGSGTCPDGSPVGPEGCPRSTLPCVLTQIGSLDYLCPQNGDFGICCSGFCAFGDTANYFCCGLGASCKKGTNCGPNGTCV